MGCLLCYHTSSLVPVPHEEERQSGVNSFAESAMFCKTFCALLEYLSQNKVDSDGRLIYASPNRPSQQFNVSIQVVPQELWEVPRTNVYLDKLHQALHGTLGDYTH